ncbi:MAG TPA: DUF1841 family protein [Burkholderiales bacterium]
MFNPSRDQVRQFFFDAWRKYGDRSPLTGLEPMAVDVMLAHPEYRDALEHPERYVVREYTPESGESNPFLHLSLHLAIEEQISIDQPPGIRAEFERIARARGDRHEALHAVLECLGETVWRAQRDAAAPDAAAYLECLRKR